MNADNKERKSKGMAVMIIKSIKDRSIDESISDSQRIDEGQVTNWLAKRKPACGKKQIHLVWEIKK